MRASIATLLATIFKILLDYFSEREAEALSQKRRATDKT